MKTNIKLFLFAHALILMSAMSLFAQDSKTGFVMPALKPQSPLAGMHGNHVGIRVPEYEAAVKWYTEKLDFRIIHEWPYADEKLAYLAPANNNDFWIEILAEGKLKNKVKYDDLGKSLEDGGYHHLCLHVNDLDQTLKELKKRGVSIVGEPFYLEAITRKLAFFQDPWGNMIELAEVVKKNSQHLKWKL
ncbi:VOC family protein [Pedobacter sp. ISL-68]|uniref:VOC family protein n=1 Tax=unclassified Pedobacter TaxID=2628915 RepID=UPI001BE53809|nr:MULTISPECIES: VOC family protein [unclassified Pedobacter]MBT2560247.1 VOC family protein [Pedobacter sp. ISL-64]MBT2589227.1 VOC family protein [Pedobacter sp. ISL-68]